ncbi:heparinase II/III family protein [Bosea lathyri]|uniref:Heparinase II/III-like protein n=1 Tax=Bosea lathyri TaxID=1036778 RepID=A0A1H6BGI1_9HYPH|nr:heparinase II/III family protein [Bosea lathyri]SEG59869.1 Heparinase II/III-like protein [Bosea lathyri]
MSLAWYVKRLANMSVPEIAHRGVEQARRSISRRRTYGWEAFGYSGEVRGVPAFAEALRAGRNPAFDAALRRSVTELLAGRFAAHGVAWPQRDPADLFPASIWRLDPVTGNAWPGAEIYCFDLKYRHARGIGDIKYVWDFNRLQFLQPLAAAACLWPEDKAPLAAIEAAIESWSDANPPFGGLGWNSGIELALRAVSLVLVLSLCGERLRADTVTRIGVILAAHLYWMTRYPSRFSSANNHLMAEAMGEFAAAYALPDLPRVGEIAAHARAVLEHEAGVQIVADGVGAEQSPTYGAFTAEMLLVADVVARAGGRPLAPIVEERLTAFANFVAWLADGEGFVPAICDDDEGRVLSLSDGHETRYPASVARAIAGHFGRPPELAPVESEAELRDAVFAAPHDTKAAPQGVRCFRQGGYTVVREERAGRKLRLTFDHGPLGYLSIAAHGHADANAITLSLDDQDIFVDPGTFLYHSGGEWRDWFRGTPAHNSVTLQGQDQSTIAGPFNWSHKANATLDEVREGADWRIAARHDGYVKRFGATHWRAVEACAGGIVIRDKLLGETGVPAEVVFQLAPGLDLAGEGAARTVTHEGRAVLRIAFSAPGDILALPGGGAVDGGWVSPRFGAKRPAARLVWRGMIPPSGLETSIDWS